MKWDLDGRYQCRMLNLKIGPVPCHVHARKKALSPVAIFGPMSHVEFKKCSCRLEAAGPCSCSR